MAHAEFRTRHLGSTVKLLGRDYSTLAEAAANADYGDTICVPGDSGYDVGASALVWPTGVHLIGLGHWRDTAITGSSPNATIKGMLGRNRIQNIQFQNTSTVVAEDITFADNMGAAMLLGQNASAWQAGTYSKHDSVAPSISTTAIALHGGDTGESEPTWPTEDGATVVDGEITWMILADPMPADSYISNCGFFSDTGMCLTSGCGYRQIVQACTFLKWGRWAVQASTGGYEFSKTPPKHGLCLYDCIAENHMSLAAFAANEPVGFARLLDRILVLRNCQISMSCDADLGFGGVAGRVCAAYRYAGQLVRAVGNEITIVGASNNNKVAGFINKATPNLAHGPWNMELRNNTVMGATSHASGVLHFEDTAGFGGVPWSITGGNVTRTNWAVAGVSTQIIDTGGLALANEQYIVADLAAGDDLAATTCLKLPKAATLYRCLLFLQGTPVGVDGSNTVAVTIKDGDGNTIVTRTYNTIGTAPSTVALAPNAWHDLGNLNAAYKILAADEAVTVEIAQGATADLPRCLLMVQYQ